MLSSPNRLTKDREIKKVLAQGRSFFSPYFRIRRLANQLSDSRFAITVSTRVSKKATVRNRVRRQLRAIIRTRLPELKTGYDIILTVNVKALELTYEALEQEMLRVFKKANLR